MGVPFYIMCLDLFMVDDASEAVEELNRLKLKNAWLKKTLQALKKRRKEMEKKFAEENKKWVAEIEESKLIAFEEQIKKIERLNAYAIQTRRGGTLDWVYKAVAASTGALAGVALVSFFHLRKKQ